MRCDEITNKYVLDYLRDEAGSMLRWNTMHHYTHPPIIIVDPSTGRVAMGNVIGQLTQAGATQGGCEVIGRVNIG